VSLDGRIFAAMYDRMSAASETAGLADHRRLLPAGAYGRVVEIGAGTGTNLEYNGQDQPRRHARLQLQP